MSISIFIEQIQRNATWLLVIVGGLVLFAYGVLGCVAVYFRIKGDWEGLRQLRDGEYEKAFDRLERKPKEKRR